LSDRSADLAALRALPRQLVAAGYLDALAVRGSLALSSGVERDLEVLTPSTSALVELMFLRRDVARDRVERALSARTVEALVALGILVARGDALSMMQLVALPVFGRIVLVPSPAGAQQAFLGDEVLLLLSRMSPTPGSVLILGGGPGPLAIHAAATAQRVLAIDPDPALNACAELNATLHAADAIELRRGELDAPLAETFDRVVVAAPTLPLPIVGVEHTGPAVLARILGRLPTILARDGIAQLAGVLHGGDDGPTLPSGLDTCGLRITMTIASRQSLAPGKPLFDAIVGRIALRSPDPQAVRRLNERFLVDRGITHLYLTTITATHSAEPVVELTRHWLRAGGSWQRRDPT
jgi:methylase of polypeptide subunit release factors